MDEGVAIHFALKRERKQMQCLVPAPQNYITISMTCSELVSNLFLLCAKVRRKRACVTRKMKGAEASSLPTRTKRRQKLRLVYSC